MKNTKKTSVSESTAADKVYRLIRKETPLTFMLPSKNSSRYSLMYYDEAKKINRPMRYAKNHASPFEDEQDGQAILEHIVFEDGFLRVPRNNQVLQKFLHFHPMNGTTFTEVNKAKDAEEQVQILNLEVDALTEAKALNIEQVETISRILFNKDASKVSSSELRRDILIYARENPSDFINLLNDSSLIIQGQIRLLFDKGLLVFKKSKKEVWYSTPSNKTRMLVVPFDGDPYDTIASYLTTDEGIESLKMLEKLL